MTGFCDVDPAETREAHHVGEALPDTRLPREFGDYELLEEIARGGMGIVYKARQRSLDRIVAIKMLLFGHFTSAEFIQRFRIEATAAGSLRHPNIVSVHAVGLQDGHHYFAMEFVDGPNLEQYVGNTPLPARRAAAYVRIIAEAVEFAHQHQVLHRDLKPSNVLIDSNDQPRVTDFGLAKRVGSASSNARSPGLTVEKDTPGCDLTMTGQMLGSPNFMPPEQISVRRGKVGPPSDVYSLGAILYHALTARPPFLGETVADTLQQVLHAEPVAPHLLNPGVPADLETICLKCLEREPVNRYATAQGLADELNRMLRGEPILARPVTRLERSWRWAWRNPALAAVGASTAMLLLILAFGSPLVAIRIRQARESARENLYAADISTADRAIHEGDLGRARMLLGEHIPSPGERDLRGFEWRYLAGRLAGDERVTIATNVDATRHLALSPDGQLVGAKSHLWRVATGRIESELGSRCEVLAFAPRGQTVLFMRGGGTPSFMRRDLATGRDTPLLEGETVAAVSFSKTGHWMATGTDRGLRLWDATTWELVSSQTNAPFNQWAVLGTGLSAFNGFSSKGLAFSPDERVLVAATGYALSDLSELSAWSVPSGERIRIPTSSVHDMICVVFAPDGQEFLTGNWDGSIRVWDALTMLEIPSRRTTNAHRSWIADMGYLPGSHLLVTAGADRLIRIWDTQTWSPTVTMRGHTEEIRAMSIDPHGYIYTDSEDRCIKQWRPEPQFPADGALCGFRSPMLPAGFCDGGTVLATVAEEALHFGTSAMGS
jgi:tRNA A-37 threonylcarbamoyl transferase component Bud32